MTTQDSGSIPRAERGASPQADVLTCGASLDDLIEQVADGRAATLNDHQLDCSVCRAALEEIERAWSPVASLAAERVVPPRDLVERVMSVVRELALDVWHVVIAGERGRTRIAVRVIGRIARRAASQVPGVHVVLGRSSRATLVSDSSPPSSARPEPDQDDTGPRAVIDLAVVGGYGQQLPQVAADVRSTVQADLRDLAGLESVEVNIFVDDVVLPTEIESPSTYRTIRPPHPD